MEKITIDTTELLAEGKKRSEKIMARQAEATKTAKEQLGYCGAMISSSKSRYRDRFPDNLAVFNANICTKNGKIWYGDFDVTKDEKKLINLALTLGERIYVLYEMDGRFDSEDAPRIERAVYSTDGIEHVWKEI